jgi:hypothetical protein
MSRGTGSSSLYPDQQGWTQGKNRQGQCLGAGRETKGATELSEMSFAQLGFGSRSRATRQF